MEEKEITVQPLIGLLSKIPNKDCPIDIRRQGCYGKNPERHCIVPVIRQYRSDVLGEVRAYSIETIRRSKYDIECDLVDGYVPLTLEDCEDELDDLDEGNGTLPYAHPVQVVRKSKLRPDQMEYLERKCGGTRADAKRKSNDRTEI